MADQIIIKTNDPAFPLAVPSPCELQRGEIAINANTGKMYALDDSTPPQVRELGGAGGASDTQVAQRAFAANLLFG